MSTARLTTWSPPPGGAPVRRRLAVAPRCTRTRRAAGRTPSSCVRQRAIFASCCTRNAPSGDAYGDFLGKPPRAGERARRPDHRAGVDHHALLVVPRRPSGSRSGPRPDGDGFNACTYATKCAEPTSSW